MHPSSSPASSPFFMRLRHPVVGARVGQVRRADAQKALVRVGASGAEAVAQQARAAGGGHALGTEADGRAGERVRWRGAAHVVTTELMTTGTAGDVPTGRGGVSSRTVRRWCHCSSTRVGWLKLRPEAHAARPLRTRSPRSWRSRRRRRRRSRSPGGARAKGGTRECECECCVAGRQTPVPLPSMRASTPCAKPAGSKSGLSPVQPVVQVVAATLSVELRG